MSKIVVRNPLGGCPHPPEVPDGDLDDWGHLD